MAARWCSRTRRGRTRRCEANVVKIRSSLKLFKKQKSVRSGKTPVPLESPKINLNDYKKNCMLITSTRILTLCYSVPRVCRHKEVSPRNCILTSRRKLFVFPFGLRKQLCHASFVANLLRLQKRPVRQVEQNVKQTVEQKVERKLEV